MYCKYCGSHMEPDCQNCIVCNKSKNTGSNYCNRCGTARLPNNSYCVNCGIKFTKTSFFEQLKLFADSLSTKDGCSKKNTLVIGIAVGFTGLHNFYLGHNIKGLIQLLLFIFSLGFFSYVWSVVELIMLLLGRVNKDAKGRILTE